MERCRACVLPTTYSAVTFDETGLCSLCREHAASPPAGPSRSDLSTMESAFVEARAAGLAYDCVVPVSGGRDSAYVAYLVKKAFGLRPLGVNFDNGHRSAEAVSNLNALSDRLDMDLVTLRTTPGLVRRVFAHFLKTCGYFCLACDALGYLVIGSFAVREARRLGRRILVVGGWSKRYEYQPGLSVLSMRAFREILARDPALLQAVRECPLVEPAVFDALTSMEDARQMGDAGRTGLRLIQLPEYVDWDYRDMGPLLEREVGWRRPPDGREAHFDCELAPIPEYLKRRKFGFSQDTLRMGVLVREGRMTREEALRKEEAASATEPEVFRRVLGDWGMAPDEVAWDADWPR